MNGRLENKNVEEHASGKPYNRQLIIKTFRTVGL